jgi:hypothetical protein
MFDNLLSIFLRGRQGLVESRVREHVGGDSHDVLSDVSDILRSEPSSHIHVCEFKASAGVSRIASDNTRREDAPVDVYITHGYIPHSDSRVHVAVSVEGVQHAPGAATVRLLLLLSAYVNAPPEGIFHFQTIVYNILNKAISVSPGI